MTRKDYQLIANVILAERKRISTSSHRTVNERTKMLDTTEIIALELSNALLRDNPRFVPKRFLQACGILYKAKEI